MTISHMTVIAGTMRSPEADMRREAAIQRLGEPS